MVIIVAVSGGGEEATPEPATSTGTTETTPAEAPAEEPAEAPAEEVKGIGESLKVGDVVYTVNSRTEATNVGGEFGQTAKGKYLVLDVTVKNEGNEALLVDTSLFKLVS